MPRILHLVEHLENNKTIKAILNMAKWSARQYNYQHTVMALDTASPVAGSWASEADIALTIKPDAATLLQQIEEADIVQIEYTNTPIINTLLRRPLPPARFVLWCHSTGDVLPHILPLAAAQMVEVRLASTMASYHNHPAFAVTNASEPIDRQTCIVPPADFSLLNNFESQPHSGFNVGFSADTPASELREDLVALTTAIEIPDVSFMICGDGSTEAIETSAKQLHAGYKFSMRPASAFPETLAELDVFGYAVKEHSGSTAALHLQQAMFAGVAPVVFTHSSIGGLIKHNETGLIVHTAEDFQRAVTFLYNNPVERARIGLNASIFARTHLGATNAAYTFNKIYSFLASRPKQVHAWGCTPYGDEALQTPTETPGAAQIFTDALDDHGLAFAISLHHPEISQQIAADNSIAAAPALLCDAIMDQNTHAPSDPHLQLWKGLVHEKREESEQAVSAYTAALANEIDSWRVEWYLARALKTAGKEEEARRVYAALRNTHSNFNEITGDLTFSEARKKALEFSIKASTPETENHDIKVSAIVSTYASEEFMDGCLHNLVSQSLYQQGGLEIIVIDAHSPENEKEIVERYQRNFDNIHYVRAPERETLYASWNRGIRMASGRYITNANTDDRHRKDALETLARYLDAHPEFALLYPGQIDTSVAHESFETTSSSKLLNWPPYSYAELERHCIIGSQPMWRKSLHEKYGYFRDEMVSAGDYEFWLRIGKQENLYRYPETLGLYYRNPAGIEHGSNTSDKETLQIWQEYGMFERGIPVILRGRLITQARVPQFSAPASTQQKPRLPFDQYIAQFETALRNNKLDEALVITEHACREYGELPYPFILKAIVHRQSLAYNEALSALDTSIRIDETPEALVELIQLSIATDQHEEAKRTSDYMRAKYPEWEERMQKITASLLQDDTAPATGSAKLEDLDYTYSTFAELKAAFESLLHTKELHQAGTLALAATLKFPENHEAWMLKATSDRLKGAYEDARAAIQKSLLIEDSPEALIELFQVSRALGDSEEANNIATMFGTAYPEHATRFSELFPETV